MRTLLVPFVVLWSALASAAPLSGVVLDPDGLPIAGAQLRFSPMSEGVKPLSGDLVVLTDADGRFEVESPAGLLQQLYVGIGKLGYLNSAGIMPGDAAGDIGSLVLEPLPPIDNKEYAWWKPFWPVDDQSDVGCNACHGEQYRDWRNSEMAFSATNPRVLSLYEGTDIDGNRAGEGYRIDHPDKAGPCANCHAPAAALDAPGEVVLSEVEGIAAEGVFCDTCHKIRDVVPDGGPGVAGSLQYQRPSAWMGLFAFGPYEDVGSHPMSSSYSPLIKTSRFCAGCHEWTNEHGVPVMSTYSEWSAVAGADPDALQCQDCHMKKKFGADYFGEPDEEAFIVDNEHVQQNHGVRRKKATIYPHTFHGAKELVEEAAGVDLELADDNGSLVVTVGIDNVNAGHALPTGMPFRHMLLVVEATADGAPLELSDGPVVPDYGGNLAGRPGRGYARVLGDADGNRNVPFWRATEVLEDTRIRGAERDEVTLRFAGPEGGGEVSVTARLVYRRAFQAMMEAKKWNLDDTEIGLAEASAELSPAAAEPIDAGVPDAAPAADDDSEEGTSDGCGCAVGDRAAPAWMLLLLGLLRRRRD